MLYSQNGYAAKEFSLMATYSIKGSDTRITMRKGDVSVVLLYVAQQFNDTVERLIPSQCGGYNPRSIIGMGSRDISNHASGTAIDLNWGKHVMGVHGTFSAKQVAAIRRILSFLEGVVRWGGDYHSRKDEMHFEINAPLSKVAAVADKIRNGGVPPKVTASAGMSVGATLKVGSTGPIVKYMQQRLNKDFPRYSRLAEDGKFGPRTQAVVKEFQRRTGLVADGIVGPKTRAMMKRFGINL